MSPTCLTEFESYARGLNKTLLSYTTSLFFPGSNSRDLRSHRLGYHYGVTLMGLNPIFFDALSITFRDSPFVKGSARFLSVCIYETVITPEFLIFLTDFSRLLTCLDDFALSLALFTFVITVWLSQFIRMAGNGFSTTGKSIKSARSHSASTEAVSKAASSASMVDLVNMVCLQDLHDTTPPPRRNAYPLVA